jgi:hypothetical protein
MARITARAGFGEASNYEAVDIDISSDEVYPEWIPSVTKEVPVLNEDGTAKVNDDGTAVVTTEVVTPGRQETIEEALVKYLKGQLGVDDVERSGIENITATIEYTITGTLEFNASDWGIDLEDFEVSAEDVDDYFVQEHFEDLIRDGIFEDCRDGYSVEVEFEVNYTEAE